MRQFPISDTLGSPAPIHALFAVTSSDLRNLDTGDWSLTYNIFPSFHTVFWMHRSEKISSNIFWFLVKMYTRVCTYSPVKKSAFKFYHWLLLPTSTFCCFRFSSFDDWFWRSRFRRWRHSLLAIEAFLACFRSRTFLREWCFLTICWQKFSRFKFILS